IRSDTLIRQRELAFSYQTRFRPLPITAQGPGRTVRAKMRARTAAVCAISEGDAVVETASPSSRAVKGPQTWLTAIYPNSPRKTLNSARDAASTVGNKTRSTARNGTLAVGYGSARSASSSE